eukprot:gnl/TRDRNA2_/TRDRNA2_177435_c0_seq1.p1 gnl/TRDRNA2_/TRDRNA2_177435_c0~~gnl/TRDRNA2_/TRDRNA2_177435_c0_seq1.p1  ORF type:complete len:238 (-),score=46.68 gnl/TRDRNA2_/TRDRNA2_177435_c0_seq1:37-750(-)
MIHYQSGILTIFQLKGSVFPFAFLVAFPCAVLAAVLKWLQGKGLIDFFLADVSILSEPEAYAGFSFLVGFLVVFRTNQAYNRFWEGVQSTVKMQAEWFDAISSLIAFCKCAKVEEEKILKFQHTLVRLYSLLDAAAVAEIEEKIIETEEDGPELIDVMGIDRPSLVAFCETDQKVEMAFQWCQMLVVEAIGTGVLIIPAPILSRAFQEFATGMVNFHEAIKIATVPLPFPYAQTTEA